MALSALAIGDQAEIPEGVRIGERILADPITWTGPWFFYRAWQDSVGLSLAKPAIWAAYAGTVASVLIDHQGADGSWPAPPGDNEDDYGATYRTSMAVLALAVNRQVLPLYKH
jgi:hypothetical protein